MREAEVHIGIDFDNTIVCYDALFHRLASERSLIPPDLPANKTAVRNRLRSIGRESEWTALQGMAYGERMGEAAPFPGVLEFFKASREGGMRLTIISHRTRNPIAGEPFDLHQAAFHWLEMHGVLDMIGTESVFFEVTREAKAGRIREQGCTHFIDDLPEFFSEANLPSDVRRILFDPAGTAQPQQEIAVASSWAALPTCLGR